MVRLLLLSFSPLRLWRLIYIISRAAVLLLFNIHCICTSSFFLLPSSFFLLLLPSFFFYSVCSVHIPGNNRYGSQPIHLAATSGSKETVALLLTNGALPNTPNKRGSYPLHGAAMVGDVDAVIVLLEFGALPNVLNEKGETPLQVSDHCESFYCYPRVPLYCHCQQSI